MIVAIPIEGNLWFWADNQHPGQFVRCSSFYDLVLQASRASAPNHLVWEDFSEQFLSSGTRSFFLRFSLNVQ
jgi:hypothetical protein